MTVGAGGGQPSSQVELVVGSSAAGALLFLFLLCLFVYFLRRRCRSDPHIDTSSEARDLSESLGKGAAPLGSGRNTVSDRDAVEEVFGSLQSPTINTQAAADFPEPYVVAPRVASGEGPPRPGLTRRNSVVPFSLPEKSVLEAGPAGNVSMPRSCSPAQHSSQRVSTWPENPRAANVATTSNELSAAFSAAPERTQHSSHQHHEEQEHHSVSVHAASATAPLGPSIGTQALRRGSHQAVLESHSSEQMQQSPGLPHNPCSTGAMTNGDAVFAWTSPAPNGSRPPLGSGLENSTVLGMARRRSSFAVVGSSLLTVSLPHATPAEDAADSLQEQVTRVACPVPGVGVQRGSRARVVSGREQVAATSVAAFIPRASVGGGNALVAAGSNVYQPPLLSPESGASESSKRRASIA